MMARRIVAIAAGALALVLALGGAGFAAQDRSAIDWTPVGQAVGIPGTLQPGDVYRIDLPRTDLKVTIGAVRLKPAFALGGYLVFMSTGNGSEAMMMGDLVVTEKELESVMLKLEQGGIDVTAIHNHLLWEKPTVMYMHVMGRGDAVQLAQAARNALALSRTPLEPAKVTVASQQVDLDTAALDRTIGVAGKISGGVYKFSIAPAYAVTAQGMALPPAMGTTTAFAFQPLGNGVAAITGDFALLPNQVNPVIRALRGNGIRVTALHSHMLDVQPTQFFMHFFATGNAVRLAGGLRAGLDSMATS